jgi:hypothetical protein
MTLSTVRFYHLYPGETRASTENDKRGTQGKACGPPLVGVLSKDLIGTLT